MSSGRISVSPVQTWYPISSTVTLSSTVDPGWSLTGWSSDFSSTSPITLTMSDTRTVTSTFTTPPTANAGTDQTVLVNIDDLTYVLTFTLTVSNSLGLVLPPANVVFTVNDSDITGLNTSSDSPTHLSQTTNPSYTYTVVGTYTTIATATNTSGECH